MSQQKELVKIGKEAFAVIDEYFGRRAGKTRAPQNHAPIYMHRNVAPQPINNYVYHPQESHDQQVHLHRATRASSSMEATVVLTDRETALMHDGMLFMDYSKRKPTRMAF